MIQEEGWGIDDYESITDTLLFFGDGVTLDFVVPLAYKGMNSERKFYYSEYMYKPSKKYSNYDKEVINIKRRANYSYLAITQRPVRIIIGRDMQYTLQSVLEKVDKWFENGKVFAYKEGKLVTIGDNEYVVPFQNGGGLRFKPVAILDKGIYDKGVRMFINDTENWIDISAGKLKAFLNIVTKTDYYQATLAVFSSIMMSREEREKHRISFDPQDDFNNRGAFKNNSSKGAGGTSFFEKGDTA